jgi:glycerophosphoryl diester phosphodiesterase
VAQDSADPKLEKKTLDKLGAACEIWGQSRRVEVHAFCFPETASSLFRPRWIALRIFGEVFLRFLLEPFLMPVAFDLQGHRGARGLKPENTLPSFEVAFDLGVTTVETDVHLSRDGIPMLMHDPMLSARVCTLRVGQTAPPSATGLLVSSLSLDQLRCYRADGNPDPSRFPEQDAGLTPLAALFADHRGLDPYGPPSLADLFAFVHCYADDLGSKAGKTSQQRKRAEQLRFDLELKRVPFHPEVINDGFDGEAPGALEKSVLEAVRAAGMIQRTIVRSFDHRCVRALRRLEPALSAAVLVTGTAPISPASLVRQANAQIYCPDYRFLDAAQVRHAHQEGIRVVPWTVNAGDHCLKLLDWGVDGITTDYPDRIAELLRQRGIQF